MTVIDTTSLTDSVVPLAYVENITLSEGSLADFEDNNQSFPASKNIFGKTVYNDDGLNLNAIRQQQAGNTLQVDLDLFLMLNKRTYQFCNATDALDIFVVLTSSPQVVDNMRRGAFRFQRLQRLASNKRIILQTIPFKNFSKSVRKQKIMLENSNGVKEEFLKINYKTRVTVPVATPDLLASFVFTRSSDPSILGDSLGNKKQLFGRIVGDLIISGGAVETNSYFFQEVDNGLLWAGPVHRHPGTGYMAGVKHSPTPHSKLKRQTNNVTKIIDTRILNADNLMDSLEDNFKLDRESQSIKLANQSPGSFTMEKINSGVDSTISSIHTDGKVSSLVMVDLIRVLKNNSRYAKLLNTLDFKSIRNALNGTHLKNVKVNRVLDSKTAEKEKNIIDVSFMPGSERLQITEGYNLFKTSEKLELGSAYIDGGYNLPQGVTPLVITDNFVDNFSNKKFFYRLEMTLSDGIEAVIKQKIKNLAIAQADFEMLNKILLDPRMTTRGGYFRTANINKRSYRNAIKMPTTETDKLRGSERINAKISLIIASLMDILELLFNVDSLKLNQLSNGFYSQLQINTGNIKNYDNFSLLLSYLRAFIVEKINFSTESEQAYDGGKVLSGIKTFKNNILITHQTNTIDKDFSTSTGLQFFDTDSDTQQGIMPNITTANFLNRTRQELAKYFDSSEALGSAGTTNEFIKNSTRDYTPSGLLINNNLRNLPRGERPTSRRLANVACEVINHSKGDARSGFRMDLGSLSPRQRSAVRFKDNIQTALENTGISFVERSRRPSTAETNLVSAEDYFSTTDDFNVFSGSSENVEQLFNYQKDLKFPITMANLAFLNVVSSNKNSSYAPSLNTQDLNYKDADSSVFEKIPEDETEAAKYIDNLPMQARMFGNRTSSSLLVEISELIGSSRSIISVQMFPYLLFNHFIIGRVKYISGFTKVGESSTLTPLYSDLSPEVITSLPAGQKLICRVEQYVNPDFLINQYETLNLKTLGEYFTISNRAEVGSTDIINPPSLTTISDGSLRAALGNRALNFFQQTVGNRKIEQIESLFASSIYIQQPRQVRQFGFNFGSMEVMKSATQPLVQRATISTATTGAPATSAATTTTSAAPPPRPPVSTTSTGGGSGGSGGGY